MAYNGKTIDIVHINTLGVRIEQRGVIGNADECGAFRNRQHLQFLAIVGLCGTLDTPAALSKVYGVHIKFQNLIF